MPESGTLRKTLALALAFTLTACSADNPQTEGAAGSTSSVTKYYACDFLSARVISSELGMPFGEGRKTNESGGGKNRSHMTTCTWEAQANGASSADPLRDSSAVTLMLWSYRNAQLGKEYLESFREVAQETGEPMPTPVAIGDEALLDGTSVHVRKGNAAFTVTVQVYDGIEQAAAGKHAEALAKQVTAKL